MTDNYRDKLHGKPLTRSEIEIVRRLAMNGKPKDKAIAKAVGLSPHTVKNHLHRVSCKLNVYDSWTGLLVTALRRGEVTLEELVAPAHVLGEA